MKKGSLIINDLLNVSQNTLYANNYIFNLLGGKEFVVGKRKKNLFSVNGKFVYYDGRRDNEIDFEASKTAGFQVEFPGQFYTVKVAPYYRFDVGISYSINAKKATHSFLLDVQNLTNRFNISGKYYNRTTESIEEEVQNGAVPFLNYKVEF